MTSNVKYSYKHLTFRSVTVLYSSNESYFCRLLHVQNANCKYTEADLTCQIAGQTLKELQALGLPVNAAAFYTECCALLFAECQYDEVRCSRWVESSFFHSYVGSLYYVPMSFDAIYMYITFTGKIIFVQVGTTHGLRENFWKMKTTHYIAVYPIERRNVCFFPSWSLGWPSKGTQLTSLFAKQGRFITGYNWTGN